MKKNNKKPKIIITEACQKDFIRLFAGDLRYAIPRWFSNTRFRAKMACQRVFREHDDTFIWDLNYKLCYLIPIILKKMIDKGTGFPVKLKSQKEWEKVLKKMAKGFKSAEAIMDSKYMVEVKLKRPKKDIFGQKTTIGYRIDKRKEAKLHKEFDEGMKLFHKHFFSLWY